MSHMHQNGIYRSSYVVNIRLYYACMANLQDKSKLRSAPYIDNFAINHPGEWHAKKACFNEMEDLNIDVICCDFHQHHVHHAQTQGKILLEFTAEYPAYGFISWLYYFCFILWAVDASPSPHFGSYCLNLVLRQGCHLELLHRPNFGRERSWLESWGGSTACW